MLTPPAIAHSPGGSSPPACTKLLPEQVRLGEERREEGAEAVERVGELAGHRVGPVVLVADAVRAGRAAHRVER